LKQASIGSHNNGLNAKRIYSSNNQCQLEKL